MARSFSRRGRMNSEDEQKMQINTLFIEEEVDGGDLVSSLFTAQIFDTNDRDEVLAGRTRLDRTRRMLEILLLRGPNAFDEFLHSLDMNGYDHVAFRLRNTKTEANPRSSSITELDETSRKLIHGHTCIALQATGYAVRRRGVSEGSIAELHRAKTVPDNVFLTLSTTSLDGPEPVLGTKTDSMLSINTRCSADDDADDKDSLHGGEKHGQKTMNERIKRVEDAWFILSRRITRVEDRAATSTQIPEEELHLLKEEISELKNDTLLQIQELTEENERKAYIIQNLTQELEERTARLTEAKERIEKLEKRILNLETEKGRAEAQLRLVERRLEEHEKSVEEQNKHFSSETLRLRNQVLSQDKRLKEQSETLEELQGRELENSFRFQQQEDELREQRLQMADQMHQLSLIAQVVHGMTQTGAVTSRPPPSAASNASTFNPAFCISGNGVNGGVGGNPSTWGRTVRSVKRSAAPPIYRTKKP